MVVPAEDFSDDAYQRFEGLYNEGNALVNAKKLDAALQCFAEALALIPERKIEWEESTWIIAAMGDTYFFKRDYEKALSALSDAVKCPEGLGNPFIHLRLGQVKFELGLLDDACDELMRAYMGAGSEIFQAEDAKYLAFLKTRASI